MHFTFFSLKRTYLQAVHKVQMPMMKRLGLTPARFDVLYLLHFRIHGTFTYQSTVRGWLGISRAAISKMMQTLERLGLVHRVRSPRNRQLVLVWLSKLGRCLFRHASKRLRLRKSGPARRAAQTIFVRRWWDSHAVLRELRVVETTFRRWRDVLADTATLPYPWDPHAPALGPPWRPEIARAPKQRILAV